ncbi:uncharacterized protein LOC135953302 [Calliphora vicina]|uniref:uncharacterized protein LOC135953302 n=1 Tax=Calliphora vicina TaxID=7373 RepID=UPI00325A54D5
METKEVEEFLKITQAYIRHLELQNMNVISDRFSYDFENLSSINFKNSLLENEILQQLAQNCKQLVSLQLECCINSKRECLQIDNDIDICIFSHMKKLNDLYIEESYDVKMAYRTFRQLYKILKLKSMTIKSAIHFDDHEEENENDHAAVTIPIENLVVDRFCDEISWFKFSSNWLGRFKNLTKLFLMFDYLIINDSVLQTLAFECQQLQELSLDKCKLTVHNFCLLPNLSILTLNLCWDLSGPNLTDILAMKKLQTLTILNTSCQDSIYDYVYFSHNLTTLTLETSLNQDIMPALSNSQNRFENVSSLIWHQVNSMSANYSMTRLQHISYIYPNLMELLLERQYIALEDLRRLTSLSVFKFYFFDSMSWNYLEMLLKLPYLTHLTIGLSAKIYCDLSQLSVVKRENGLGLTTNLEYLKIPLIVFGVALNFWLSFLQRNLKLKLQVFTYYGVKLFQIRFFERLMRNNAFPSNLKSIDICGISVDCKELKADYNTTVSKFDFKKNDQGEYYIILKNPK